MMDVAVLLLRIGVVVAVAYLGLGLWLLVLQRRYVYYPSRGVALTPDFLSLAYEEVCVSTADGEGIAAWYVPARDHRYGDLTVLFCHGNAGNMGDRLDSVLTFHNLSMNTLIFDYRGYGKSTGSPTEKGTYADALAVWKYLVDVRGCEAKNIVLFGRSLGGSVAAWLATQVSPLALVVESAFTSAPDMAARMFPLLPARWLCRFGYDTLAFVRSVSCPVLVAHSVEDEMVPYAHGRALMDAAREPKHFVSMRGGHNSGGLDGDVDYQQALVRFVVKAVEARGGGAGGVVEEGSTQGLVMGGVDGQS